MYVLIYDVILVITVEMIAERCDIMVRLFAFKALPGKARLLLKDHIAKLFYDLF